MPTIVIDLDGTLADPVVEGDYEGAKPNGPVVSKLREYRSLGFRVAVYTARNMRTFSKSIGEINAVTLPMIVHWLTQHNIPFDEVHVGKPWPEEGGFYVDDRAIRPDEFVKLSHAEVMNLTGAALQ